MIGIVLAALAAKFMVKRRNKDYMDFVIISALIGGFAVIFAKLLFLLVSVPFKDLFKVLKNMIIHGDNSIFTSGYVFYGGVIGGVIGFFIGVKIAKCKVSDFVDFYAVLIPLIHAFGRIGCFCGGCCYGIPYDGPFSVVYNNPITSVPAGIGIFPVQLFESLLLFILSFVMYILFIKDKKYLILYYFISYGCIRFSTEFLRYDSERGSIFGISTSQFISIIAVIVSIAILIFIYFRTRKKGIANKTALN